MTKTNTFKFVLTTLFVATSLWVAPTLARYPERQVTIVVPYPLRYANLKQQDYQKFLDAEEARLRRLIKTEGAGIQLE